MTALHIAEQDLTTAIDDVRKLHRRGKVVSTERTAEYLRHLRDIYRYHGEAMARGETGPLVEPKNDMWKPTPIHTGFVGISAEQRAEREWKGVFNAFPFWVYARRSGQNPVHFLQAAE